MYPVVLAALLFSIGVYGVLARRNAILVLMSVELMLNAVNLDLVTFDVWLRDGLHAGQALTLFVIVIAAAEVGLGLAIVLLVFRNRETIAIDALRALAEEGTGDGWPPGPPRMPGTAGPSPLSPPPSGPPPGPSEPGPSGSGPSGSGPQVPAPEPAGVTR